MFKWWWIFLAGSAMTAEPSRVVILGTGQDGGLPQIGCEGPHCKAARKDPSLRRMTASLLIEHQGGRWLIDATPDLRAQLARAGVYPKGEGKDGRRPRLVDGIFLTHAHMGHYSGLIHLGREAYNHAEIPLYGSSRMSRYLSDNGPWSLLVENRNIRPVIVKPDESVSLAEDVEVTAFLVPHRDEYTDTFGFLIKGPNKSVLYIPDIDKWSKWDRKIEDYIARVDVALLDGTFFADGEIPGRAMSEIPHPFIEESMSRFKSLPAGERAKVVFIHLNHGNPATVKNGDAQKKITAAGMSVAEDGMVINL